eukprot:COSAG04_NODE_3634_length_2656_cov_1.231521_6_plen_103_part_00
MNRMPPLSICIRGSIVGSAAAARLSPAAALGQTGAGLTRVQQLQRRKVGPVAHVEELWCRAPQHHVQVPLAARRQQQASGQRGQAGWWGGVGRRQAGTTWPR